jgi:hypothetical protein
MTIFIETSKVNPTFTESSKTSPTFTETAKTSPTFTEPQWIASTTESSWSDIEGQTWADLAEKTWADLSVVVAQKVSAPTFIEPAKTSPVFNEPSKE